MLDGTSMDEILNEVIDFIEHGAKSLKPSSSPMDLLPDEVLVHMMQNLNVKEISLFGATNKKFYTLAQDFQFWQSLNDYYFPHVRFTKNDIFKRDPKRAFVEEYNRFKSSYGRMFPSMQTVLKDLRTDKFPTYSEDNLPRDHQLSRDQVREYHRKKTGILDHQLWLLALSAGNGQQNALLCLNNPTGEGKRCTYSDPFVSLRYMAHIIAKANGYVPPSLRDIDNISASINKYSDISAFDEIGTYITSFWEVVRRAAGLNDIHLLKSVMAFRPRKDYASEIRKAFDIAVTCNSFDSMKFLVTKFPRQITLEIKREAFAQAVKSTFEVGHKETLRYILQMIKDIKSEDIKSTFINAVRKEKFDIAEIILKEAGHCISRNDLYTLLFEVQNTNAKTASFLVLKAADKLFEGVAISETTHSVLFEYLLEQREYAAAELMLGYARRGTNLMLNTLLFKAVRENKVEIVRFLVAKARDMLMLINYDIKISDILRVTNYDVEHSIDVNIFQELIKCLSLEEKINQLCLTLKIGDILKVQIIVDAIKELNPNILHKIDFSNVLHDIDPMIANHIHALLQGRLTDISLICLNEYEQAEVTSQILPPGEFEEEVVEMIGNGSKQHKALKRRFDEMTQETAKTQEAADMPEKEPRLLWMNNKKDRSAKRVCLERESNQVEHLKKISGPTHSL